MEDENSGFTIYWRIENFESDPLFDCIKSQIFKIHSMNANWQIEIQLDGAKNTLAAYLSKITNPASFFVHYSLSLLTGSGWTTVLQNVKHKFIAGGVGHGSDIVDLIKLKNEEWFYLPNGSLTISFRIRNDRIRTESSQRVMISRLIDGDYLRHRPIQTFSTLKPSDLLSFPISYEFRDNAVSTFEFHKEKDVKTQHIQTDDQKAKEVKTQLIQTDDQKTKEVTTVRIQTDDQMVKEAKSVYIQTDNTSFSFKDLDDLRKLFREKEFSFVALRTPTKEFSVHKAVLSAKSPVFNAMFGRKMKEDDCNVVDIDDIDNQTMALFVKFLHFEPLGDLKWEAAISLYYPADKYQIDSLKEICVSLLKKELSIENVCDILRLADLHQDKSLMTCAQEYFCKNFKSILPSTQWREMLGHTELVSKLLCKLAETAH